MLFPYIVAVNLTEWGITVLFRRVKSPNFWVTEILLPVVVVKESVEHVYPVWQFNYKVEVIVCSLGIVHLSHCKLYYYASPV